MAATSSVWIRCILHGIDTATIAEKGQVSDFDNIEYVPDARDGLTKKERAILYCLHQAQQELGDRNVPTILLYGRVLELVDISKEEFQSILSRFAGLTKLSGD